MRLEFLDELWNVDTYERDSMKCSPFPVGVCVPLLLILIYITIYLNLYVWFFQYLFRQWHCPRSSFNVHINISNRINKWCIPFPKNEEHIWYQNLSKSMVNVRKVDSTVFIHFHANETFSLRLKMGECIYVSVCVRQNRFENL